MEDDRSSTGSALVVMGRGAVVSKGTASAEELVVCTLIGSD